jgi:3',5'-cyclic AMP phosphodiesterase CpdA
MDLLKELKKLTRKLDQAGIDYALCSGLAIAIYAKPRATLDIDMMIQPDDLTDIKKVAEKLGYKMSSAMMEFNDGAVKLQRLSKVDKSSGEYFFLDLLIVTPEIKKAWDGRTTIEWEGSHLKVLSPQGLILLKSLRNSGQDKEDIEYLRSLENED